MKLLYLNPDRGIPVLGDKGASVHVREFVSAAAALGHEVVLACATLGAGNAAPCARLLELPVQADDASLRDACAGCGLDPDYLDNPVARRELERIAYNRGLAPRLLRELARIEFEPDVLYERHALFSSSGSSIAAALSIPRILEVNAPLVVEHAKFRGLVLRDLALSHEAESFAFPAVIIAVSDSVAAHVRSRSRTRNPIQVVANGVDVGKFQVAVDHQTIRARLGLGPGPVVGFIGSFKPWHGVDQLLDAFGIVLASHPRATLVAIGEGPGLPALRDRALRAGYAANVVFPGRVPHEAIPQWLAAMDLTVAPYVPQADFYFSPLKIVESLAAGKPVVAPRLGQIVELLGDGTAGALYTAGSVEECAEAICSMLDDPGGRAATVDVCRRLAAGRDWKAIVKRILASADAVVAEQDT
jgi:glycosyltransferase involved in cell wall biosynthesis